MLSFCKVGFYIWTWGITFWDLQGLGSLMGQWGSSVLRFLGSRTKPQLHPTVSELHRSWVIKHSSKVKQWPLQSVSLLWLFKHPLGWVQQEHLLSLVSEKQPLKAEVHEQKITEAPCVPGAVLGPSPSTPVSPIALHGKFLSSQVSIMHKDLYFEFFSSIHLVLFLDLDLHWALVFHSEALRAKYLKGLREGDFCL